MTLLAAITRAVRRRAQAEQDYRAAVQAAHEAGHSTSEIAAAAGITPRGARYLLNPDPRKEQAR